MLTFVALAALLSIAAAAIVAIPLLKSRPGAAPRAPIAALIASAVILAGATGLYFTWTNWSWNKAPSADTPQTMVARLARRLERNPNDLEGWLMLGRSYAALEQFPLAARAYQRADRLAKGQNAEALIGIAEALAVRDESALEGRAGQLIERALALEPKSGKALFYGAAAAMRRNDLQLARQRFASLLELDPPEGVRKILHDQIAAIDQRANSVQVRVSISEQLARQVPRGAPLFVFLRDPQRPGPPLAVKRLENHMPQLVELSAADAMIAGTGFANGQKVQVVARIALSGTPTAQRGDPFGSTLHQIGSGGPAELVIDRLSP